MKKLEVIKRAATRKLNRTGLKLRKNSPEILAVTGVIGIVTSVVMACKATTKLEDILDDAAEKVNTIHYYKARPEELPKEYTPKDSTKDLALVYFQTGCKLAKLYAPAVIVGTLSIGAMLTSNNILRKRNVALAATYAALDKSFKDYRGRVAERFGEAVDKELRYNVQTKEIEKTVTDENGEEKIIKKMVNVVNPEDVSPYAKFYDESCTGWMKDPEHNLMFLRRQQAFANEKFKEQGHLFLNEVYDSLGMPRTKAGNIVGWIYDEKHPVGDNYVDFGIYDINNEAKRDFVNGYERSILLDFNVDGPILDLI